MNLKDRTSHIISDVIKKYKLSNSKLAERLGYNKGTINNYRRKACSPSGDFIEVFCKKFNVNPAWLLTGQGDPYLDKKDEELGKSIAEKARIINEVEEYEKHLAVYSIEIDLAIRECLEALSKITPPPKMFTHASTAQQNEIKAMFMHFEEVIRKSRFMIDGKIWYLIKMLFFDYVQEK